MNLNIPAVATMLALSTALASAPRDFAPFEFLLERSPFSLPTAEESSPAAERYALTGAVSWDGVQRVFVLDRTSQQRHIVSANAGTANMVLLEFLPDPDPRLMRARVQIDGQVATLAFAEAQPDGGAQPHQPMPGAVGASLIQGQPLPAGGASVQQVASGQPGQAGQPRRIIRRRIITSGGSDASAQASAGVAPPPGTVLPQGDGANSGTDRVIRRQVIPSGAVHPK